MAFDEAFLRQALYQNLYDPYLTNTNGCSRADILHFAQAFFHHASDILDVPTSNGGRFVLRLGPLARANGIELSEDEAHDALADVRATVALALLMKQGSPDLWDMLIGQASRYGVEDFLANEPVFHVSFFFGGRPFSYVVTEAARNQDNDKDIALFDLTHDPAHYVDMSRDELVDVLNMSPKVIRTVRSNSQPVLVPLDRPSTHTRGTVPSGEVLQTRAQQIRDSSEFRDRLAEALPLRYEPREPSEHAEEQIFDGFPDDANRALMAKFHLTTPDKRYEVAQQFTDQRLHELGVRLLCGLEETKVPEGDIAMYHAWVQNRHYGEQENGWRTVAVAMTEIDDMERENPGASDEFDRLREYIEVIAADPS